MAYREWLKRVVRASPRPEVALLLVSFALTLAGKLLSLSESQGADALVCWAQASGGDVLFFTAALGVLATGYAWLPSWLVARVAVPFAAAVLAWSVLNAAWLGATGVQLEWGVLLVVLRHPAEFWPTVRPYVVGSWFLAAMAAVGGAASIAWGVWRMVRPLPLRWPRRRYVGWAAAATVVWVSMAVAGWASSPRFPRGSLGETLDYSSHWYVLRCALVGHGRVDNGGTSRHVPRAGERDVSLPGTEAAPLPNVVIVLLEGVSYAVSRGGDTQVRNMPVLAALAADGAEFTSTRVPVPQTGKAFWAVLSGTTPDVYSDWSEAVLVDQPYEGLPTLLGRVGYRSAFFQMAKGSFQCAPGTFANFGFGWAWFRENLQEPSANVGYLGGDDFRMLDPAFDWATQTGGPFLLMLITSVSHDPYAVPAWFGPPEQDEWARYVQTLRYTDAFLGAVCERLDQSGLTDRTLLCVLGDHGDSFRPDTRRTRRVPYEEVLRVPWVIRWPGHVAGGLRCDWPCSQMDVTPTILSLLGFDITNAGLEGRDALTPGPADRRLYFSAWYEGSPVGYVEAARKVMYFPHSGDVVEYDLDVDGMEQAPVVLTDPARTEVIEAVADWTGAMRLHFDAKRFRKRFLYDHWWAFSSGRYARAYYVP